jgi:outer membrane protein assembly factor BamB
VRRVACAAISSAVLYLCALGAHAQAASFADIEGWWIATPTYANESSTIVLQFVKQEDKQTMRLSLPPIGGYDMNAGNISVSGVSVTTDALEFPLTYDAEQKTLSGYLPEAIVPVHKIPVTFKRTDPVVKPAPRVWNHPSPKVKWRTQVNAPVWAGLEYDKRSGLLFVATDAGIVHAVDAAGKLQWSFETGKAIKARPAAIGSSVFIHSDSGYAYRLDARTGKELWRAKIDVGSPARIPVNEPNTRWDRYGSSFVSDGQYVYVASRDSHLYALDIRTGEEKWRVATRDMITATPALSGDAVIVGSFDGTVRAVGARDGAERWSYDARLAISGDVVVSGDRVLAGSRTYDLIALDAGTGKESWRHYYWFSWIESPPVVNNGVVYTGSSDATGVYAIDLSSGARKWKADVPGFAWPRPAVDQRMVVAGTIGQGPHPGNREGALLGIDKRSGKTRWMLIEAPSESTVQQKRDWGFASSPILADAIAYAADLDGTVYAIEAY